MVEDLANCSAISMVLLIIKLPFYTHTYPIRLMLVLLPVQCPYCTHATPVPVHVDILVYVPIAIAVLYETARAKHLELATRRHSCVYF